jgi:putative FmdB family regulatory protein
MPTYEYVCQACGHEYEVFQNITASPKRKCPSCKKQRLKRKIGGGAGFLFKGSGFYLTDYRSDAYKKAADADKSITDKKPTESSSTSSSAEKTDSKSSTSSPSSKAKKTKE